MAAGDLQAALDELYAAPVAEFMEARDALAKKLKAAGDKDAAAEVKKQHKPTLVAHALNQLSREARKELDELFEAGRALASGKDFKVNLERQRSALEAVKKKAGGPDVPAIIAVVQGALVDEKLAEAVRLGRFAKLPDVPVGFFGAAPEAAPAWVPLKKEERKPLHIAPLPEVKLPAKDQHRAEAGAKHAVAELKHVEHDATAAARDVKHAAQDVKQAVAQLKRVEPAADDDAGVKRELEAAEKEAAQLAGEVAELEEELLETKRRAHQATERVTKLRKRLG